MSADLAHPRRSPVYPRLCALFRACAGAQWAAGDHLMPAAFEVRRSEVSLRSESAASPKIENLTATAFACAIAEAELGHGRRNAVLIVANERAMSDEVSDLRGRTAF